MHYTRWSRHGDPLTVKPQGPPRKGVGYKAIFRPGHPLARPSDNRVYEHRFVLYNAIGPGWHPCHWCQKLVSWDLRSCSKALVVDHVNAVRLDNRLENLVPACQRCNGQRERERLPNCKKGHPYPEEPVRQFIKSTGKWTRVCQVCREINRERARARTRQKGAA